MITRLAITCGEPAGIGIDLVLDIAQHDHNAQLVVIADLSVLKQRAALLNLEIDFIPYNENAHQLPSNAGQLIVLDMPCTTPVIVGVLDKQNARYVLNTLDRALEGCLSGEFDAMVTAPLHKGIINDAGIPFSGHTEYLAQHSNTPLPVMMLASDTLKVALATTHLPLKDVSDAITEASLSKVIEVLHHDLKQTFALDNPKIYVCGLNPHAGEGGHLGMEEIEIITPTINKFQAKGMDLVGPLPADTLFTEKYLKDADAVLAMFHDQGLPVLKHASFGRAINITLGLPIIRTSVDHGTALDLAGKGVADSGSLRAAIRSATELSTLRNTT